MATNETKWTAGPWVARKDPNAMLGDDWMIGRLEGKPDEVAVCSEKDAALIAASPELAAACRELVEWADDGTSSVEDQSEALSRAIEAARAALNKAVRS